MEDKLRKVAINAKKAEPNDWYAQRTIIARVIEEIASNYPDAFQRQEFADGKIQLLSFKFEGDFYFWWDGIRDGRIVECSGFERAISRPVDGKIKTEILWNSDPTDHEPFIPQLPIVFK